MISLTVESGTEDFECLCGRNGKIQVLESSQLERVDAHHATVPVNQWATTVARIQCGIYLVQFQPICIPADAADDALGDGAGQSQRAPDGEDLVRDLLWLGHGPGRGVYNPRSW